MFHSILRWYWPSSTPLHRLFSRKWEGNPQTQTYTHPQAQINILQWPFWFQCDWMFGTEHLWILWWTWGLGPHYTHIMFLVNSVSYYCCCKTDQRRRKTVQSGVVLGSFYTWVVLKRITIHWFPKIDRNWLVFKLRVRIGQGPNWTRIHFRLRTRTLGEKMVCTVKNPRQVFQNANVQGPNWTSNYFQ